MSNLEAKLAEARTRTIATYYADRSNETAHDVWDAAVAIAREVVAEEKDAEIARLRRQIAALNHRIALVKPRKMSAAGAASACGTHE